MLHPNAWQFMLSQNKIKASSGWFLQDKVSAIAPNERVQNRYSTLSQSANIDAMGKAPPYGTPPKKSGGMAARITGSGTCIIDNPAVNASATIQSTYTGVNTGAIAETLRNSDVETSFSLREALMILASVAVGKTEIDSSTVTFRDVNDDYDRLVATMTGSERSDVTLDTTVPETDGMTAYINSKSITANVDTQEIAETILNSLIESGLTLREALRLMLSVAAGKTDITLGSPVTVKFRDINDTVDRITTTMSGSTRTTVSLVTE